MKNKFIGGNKLVKRPSEQMAGVKLVVASLLKVYKSLPLKDLRYEKTITHEFYRHFKNTGKNYNIIAEYPVSNLLDSKKTNKQRFDFYLESKKYKKSKRENMVIEIKKGTHNLNDIKEDFKKLKPLKRLAYNQQFKLGLLPLFINFFTEELNLELYKSNIEKVYSKFPINIIAICPKIKLNDLHVKTRSQKTQYNVLKACIITNYQRIVDYRLYPAGTPVILHKKGEKNARIKKLLLYDLKFGKVKYIHN